MYASDTKFLFTSYIACVSRVNQTYTVILLNVDDSAPIISLAFNTRTIVESTVLPLTSDLFTGATVFDPDLLPVQFLVVGVADENGQFFSSPRCTPSGIADSCGDSSTNLFSDDCFTNCGFFLNFDSSAFPQFQVDINGPLGLLEISSAQGMSLPIHV